MANGLVVQITHTGLSEASVLLTDIRDTTDGPAGYRKAGPVYVPAGGTIELVYSGDVAPAHVKPEPPNPFPAAPGYVQPPAGWRG